MDKVQIGCICVAVICLLIAITCSLRCRKEGLRTVFDPPAGFDRPEQLTNLDWAAYCAVGARAPESVVVANNIVPYRCADAFKLSEMADHYNLNEGIRVECAKRCDVNYSEYHINVPEDKMECMRACYTENAY